MPDNRNVSLRDIWAESAQTTIPVPPLPGIPYRNTAVRDFKEGQKYDAVYDSARHNQLLYEISSVTKSSEQFAGIPWSPLTDYPIDARVMGSNGTRYRAVEASSFADPKDPTQNSDYWSDDTNIGKHLGEVFYYQGRSAPFGAVVADGGLVQRDLYPDLWEFAQTQNLVITESAWQTQSTSQGSVGMYSSGDGATTFRLPLLTDFFRGTVDPAKVGTWQGDAIRNITGRLPGYLTASGGGTEPQAAASSALYWGSAAANATRSAVTATKDALDGLSIDVSRAVPTALENRPKTLFLLPCIHAYNAVIPDAQADMHAMMAALSGKVDRVDWQTLVEDKAWKLPNGLIIQMFTTSSNLPANSDTAVTAVFPVTFPNKCLQVVLGLQSSAPRTFSVSWHTITNANVKVYYGNAGATAMTGAVVSLLAVGM